MATGVTADDPDAALVTGAMSLAGYEGSAAEYPVQRRLPLPPPRIVHQYVTQRTPVLTSRMR